MFHLSETYSRCIREKKCHTPRFGLENCSSDLQLSDLLSKVFCLSIGMKLEAVVFHIIRDSAGVLSPVVELIPFHKIQLHSVTPDWFFPVLSLQDFV